MAPSTQPDPPGHTDADTQATLEQLHTNLLAARATNIGFPAATDLNFGALAPFLDFMLNNLGGLSHDGLYAYHTKDQEREVITRIADLLRAPVDDRWGYVASGASEGTEHALWLARHRFPRAVVYHTAAAHHCVPAAVDRLGMAAVTTRVDQHGEVDYDDLATQIDQRRHRPVVVVANVGTGWTEAIDDIRRIRGIVEHLAVRRAWVHADAALAGIPLALVPPHERPGFDLPDGADSIVVSGHKFLGSPTPCAVLVLRDSLRPYPSRGATYTGAPDSTLTNSRSGLAALGLWLTLRRHGDDELRARADGARALAAYAHGRLVEVGWPAQRHQPHAFTVVLDTPPAQVLQRWPLPRHGHSSHIVCMPGITREQIDAFVGDLPTTRPLRPAVTQPQPTHADGHRGWRNGPRRSGGVAAGASKGALG